MPVVKIHPKNQKTEDMLADIIEDLRLELMSVICRIADAPENDVIIDLMKCTIRNPDSLAVDFVLYADTCPHENLEPHADELRDEIAKVLSFHGLTVGTGTEVWLRFLPGSWCWVRDGEIVDSVSHPRTPVGSLEPFFELVKDQFYTGRIQVKRRCLASIYAMQMMSIQKEEDLELLGKNQIETYGPERMARLEILAQQCQRRLNLAGLGDL